MNKKKNIVAKLVLAGLLCCTISQPAQAINFPFNTRFDIPIHWSVNPVFWLLFETVHAYKTMTTRTKKNFYYTYSSQLKENPIGTILSAGAGLWVAYLGLKKLLAGDPDVK